MHCQQTPQNHIEFLADNGYPDIRKQMSYDVSSQVPSLGLTDPSQLDECLKSHTEGNFIAKFTRMEHHLLFSPLKKIKREGLRPKPNSELWLKRFPKADSTLTSLEKNVFSSFYHDIRYL